MSESSDREELSDSSCRPSATLRKRLLARLIDWVAYGTVGFSLIFSLIVGLVYAGPAYTGMGSWNADRSGTTIMIATDFSGIDAWKYEFPRYIMIENVDMYGFLNGWVLFFFWYLILIVGFLAISIYELPLTAVRGQTVGKMLTNVRVVSVEDGGVPGWGRSCMRWAVLYLPLLVPFGVLFTLLAGVSPRFDVRRRGWHDKVAGTMVVQVTQESATVPRNL